LSFLSGLVFRRRRNADRPGRMLSGLGGKRAGPAHGS
jgi:hypothetical protein